MPKKEQKNEPHYETKVSSKILHWERGWEEALVKIAISYHNGVASLRFDNNSNFFKRNTGNY